MIPLYKNSLARIDLHSVLEKMVQYAIDGFDAGQVLARQLASRLGCTTGIVLRTPQDVFQCILEVLRETQGGGDSVSSQKSDSVSSQKGSSVSSQKSDSVSSQKSDSVSSQKSDGRPLFILPITCPTYIVYSLRHMHCDLYFYDVAEDGISPLVHKEELEKQMLAHKGTPILWVAVYLFSTSNTQTISVPPVLRDIASLAIAFTIPPQKEENGQEQTEMRQEQTEQYFSDYDFVTIILEQNTFITGASGMMLCVRTKKQARQLKLLGQYYLQLSDLNAALAHSQFRQLDSFIKKVLHTKELYSDALTRSKYDALECITEEDAVPLSFPVRCRANVVPLLRFIQKQKVESGLAFRDSYLATFLDNKTEQKNYISRYPHASKLVQSTILLPLYASLQKDEAQSICKILASLP